MADLVTKEKAFDFLSVNQPASGQELLMQLILVPGVSAAVRRYCGRDLLQASYTEYHDGHGREKLYLNQYPIISTISPAVTPAVAYYDINEVATVVALTDFRVYPEEGCLKLKPTAAHSSVFLKGDRNYKVEYSAGYAAASLPADITLACLTWIAVVFQRIEHKLHAVASKSFGDENITYRFDKIPPEVEAMLEAYRRPMYG